MPTETRILMPKGAANSGGDYHTHGAVNSSFGNNGKHEYYDAAGSRLIYGSRHTDGPYTFTGDMDVAPNFRRTLTDINLLDADTMEDIHGHRLGRFIWKDFCVNFLVVTIPAIFTNFAWRAMNLAGVAVHESPRMVIVWTIAYIATAVFGICALVDMIRQLIIFKGSFKEYWNANGLRASINLGWKFFMGVIGWTIGYEVVAGTHMFYAGDATAQSIVYHAIGAAVGEFFGLLVACEVTHITEFIFTGQLSTHPPTGSLGVATKGLLEGAVWSVIGDENLYEKWGSTFGSGFADSLILGLAAALAFSVMGILTSTMGYFFIHRRLKLAH